MSFKRTAVEVPGPPDWASWYFSWRVFENVMVGLTIESQMWKALARLSTTSCLNLRSTRTGTLSELVKAYPEVWNLCMVAEGRCRAEHFTRLRRKAEDDHILGLMPRFGPNCPWDTVLRMAAHDRAYWDECVREPALKFIASGPKHAGQPTGSLTGEVHIDEGSSTRKKAKREKARGGRGGKLSAPLPPPSFQGTSKGRGW